MQMFGVSNLFLLKGINEKPLGGRLDPPGKGMVNVFTQSNFRNQQKSDP